jgi:transmembrane sensor
MTRAADQGMIDQAIGWHLRNADETQADWDGFTAWLEADPRHNEAYETVADAEFEFDRLYRLVEEGSSADLAQSARRTRFRRKGWRIGALAASVALATAGIWVAMGGLSQRREIVTAPGEMRTLALADGTRIVVNGNSRLVLYGNDPRRAELQSGEAQFSVRHDAAHPFTLTLGTQRVVDVGTVFNVYRSDRSTRVEVAEGSVRFEDGETRLRLDPGDTLMSNGDGIVEDSKPVDAIGSWTRGALIYRGAPLVDVVGDLSRSRGITIELGPELSSRTFTGVIQLGDNDDELRARVGKILGVKIARTPEGWTITR